MKKIISYLLSVLFFVNVLFAQHTTKKGTPDKRYKENKTSTYKSSSTKPSSTSKSYTKSTKPKSTHYSTSAPSSVQRDKNGKIKRSSVAKHDFMKQSGYPKGRKGYVVDHKIPLKKGGCDCPSNMQWQTIEEGKAKDKWE